MIRLDQDGPVWTVTLDRTDKANALTEEMLSELVRIAQAAQEARAFILTGAGRVFSAGADLEAARAGLALSPLWEQLSAAIAALPGLSIAALNGTVAGGSMGMVLACDLRLAVPTAQFFYPVMKMGFLPQPSDPGRMAALIGPARTKLLLMGGEKIDAYTALDYGLIERILDPSDLLSTATQLASDAAAAKPDIARGIKRLCAGLDPKPAGPSS